VETEQEDPRASRASARPSCASPARARDARQGPRSHLCQTISSSGEVYALLKEEMLSSDRERFLALLLDGKNKLLG